MLDMRAVTNVSPQPKKELALNEELGKNAFVPSKPGCPRFRF
jgi:hypothetical protein